MTPLSSPDVHPARDHSALRALPAAVLAVLTVVLAIPFAKVPFPFIDLYSNLSTAEALSWPEMLRSAFAAGVEYRPLLTIASKAAYDVFGLELTTYKAIVLLQFAGILGVLLWMYRPAGPDRVVAAVVSLLCVAGLHSSRILFNFNPLNAHSGVLLIVLLGAAAAFDPRTQRWNYIWFVITLGAVLTLESGLLLIPVLAALRLVEAPGIGWRGLLAALAAVACYAVIHLALGAPIEAGVHTHSGLGFSAATPERLDAIFGRWPWLFWIYNVAATLFTVAFSEPREGTYVFIDSVRRGSAPVWMWLHVISSIVTTIVIVVAHPRRNMTMRDRCIGATAVALILGGSALGFLYTRDRIALPVGIGYAMLLYVALSALLEKSRRPRARTAAGMVVSLIAAAWLVRDAETYWFLRDLAWEHHREWTVRYDSIRNGGPETDLMRVLQALARRHTPADPAASPAWANDMLERKFGPGPDNSGR